MRGRRGSYRGQSRFVQRSREDEKEYNVYISGFTQGLPDLLHLENFLLQKAPTKINVTCTTHVGQGVQARAADYNSYNALLGMSGIRYKGSQGINDKLIIQPNEEKQSDVDFEQIVRQSFDMSSNSLFFRNISEIDLGIRKNALGLFSSIQKFCSTVKTIDFSSNNISTLKYFYQLREACPQIERISFENNRIKNWSDIEALEDMKNSLVELVFIGNPICPSEVQKKLIYRQEMKKRFPKLQILDREQLLEEQNDWNPPCIDSFIDNEQTRAVVTQFMSLYFEKYDSQRALLEEFYHPNAIFSVSVLQAIDTQVFRDVSKERGGLSPFQLNCFHSRPPKGKVHIPFRYKPSNDLLKLKSFINIDSNLVNSRKKSSSISFSAKEIVKTLSSLPESTHLQNTFICDSWQLPSNPPSIYVYLNGEFFESKTGMVRCFSRTFVLIPSGNERIPVVIVNDSLSIIAQVNEPSASKYPCVIHELSNNEKAQLQNNQHREKIEKISLESGVNLAYASQALENNKNDEFKALEALKILKSNLQLPPEAFIRQ